MKALKPIKGKGLARIPGAWLAFDFLFKYLWPGKNIVEVEGSKIYVNMRDELLFRKTYEAYIVNPKWENVTTDIFKALVKEGDVVLDLGANLGFYSLLAAKLVGSNGKVYSFEPEPRNYKMLVKNIALNGYTNIMPVQKAVSDKNEKVKLFLSDKDSGAHTIRQSHNKQEYKESVEVETISLDKFFEDKNPVINLIKMDIEGAEPKAFAGMNRILRENKDLKIIVEFYPAVIKEADNSPEEFAHSLMEDYNFSVVLINDQWQKLGLEHTKYLQVSSVDEFMEFLKGKMIVNLLLSKR